MRNCDFLAVPSVKPASQATPAIAPTHVGVFAGGGAGRGRTKAPWDKFHFDKW